MIKPTLIGMAEAAHLLGVSIFTVRRLADAAHVKTVYVGSRRLIPVSEIERIVVSGTGKHRSTPAINGRTERIRKRAVT